MEMNALLGCSSWAFEYGWIDSIYTIKQKQTVRHLKMSLSGHLRQMSVSTETLDFSALNLEKDRRGKNLPQATLK
jgi:hypothetical protein